MQVGDTVISCKATEDAGILQCIRCRDINNLEIHFECVSTLLHTNVSCYLAVNCCVHFPIKLCDANCVWCMLLYPSLVCTGSKRMVGECPNVMSLPVLIAKTECKSFANSLHLYELFFFSLASVKKRPHTLHLRFTYAVWISIQYCMYYGRLNLLLVRVNARSILVRSYSQTPQQENELLFCVSVCICVCC